MIAHLSVQNFSNLQDNPGTEYRTVSTTEEIINKMQNIVSHIHRLNERV